MTVAVAHELVELANDLARAVSEWAGRSIAYTNLPEKDYAAALIAAGLPAPFAETLADCDAGVARGELEVKGGALRRLIGREPTSLEAALARLKRA